MNMTCRIPLQWLLDASDAGFVALARMTSADGATAVRIYDRVRDRAGEVILRPDTDDATTDAALGGLLAGALEFRAKWDKP